MTLPTLQRDHGRWAFREAFPLSARARNARAMFDALFSLSQTQRRLAHRCKREALEWEAKGNRRFYAELKAESDRLWKDAWWHLAAARREKEALL